MTTKACVGCGVQIELRGNRKSCSAACLLSHHVQRRGPDECWPWTGARIHGYGYLRVRRDGRMVGIRSHKLAYELATGERVHDPDVVMHVCDNRPCCNPQHLRRGTRPLNNADRNAKGRQACGTMVNTARLTESDVVAIRERRAAGALHRELAAEYGVNRNTIMAACSRNSWKHVS